MCAYSAAICGVSAYLCTYAPAMTYETTDDARLCQTRARDQSPSGRRYDVGSVPGHRACDVAWIRLASVVRRQLADVAEVLDVEVRRHRPDEHRRLLKRIRECVRHANWHHDHRPRFDVNRVGAARKPDLAAGHDEHFLVFAVD